MSTAFTPDEPIESTEAFESALIELVQLAQENGVDPEGFYESHPENGHASFELAVLELAN